MIFLTGDTHIPYDVEKLNFPEGKKLTKNDYVIVLGDFGILWAGDSSYQRFKEWRRWFEKRKFTTLWIDGNHENHEWLNSLDVSEWNGGKVHVLSDSIIHLMRGQVFNIEGHTFFTMGGAASIDKHLRTEGLSWWREELPSHEECKEGLMNLAEHGDKVDYILTHTCPKFLIVPMFQATPLKDCATDYFNVVQETVEYKRWYFGHWHTDKDYGKFSCLYSRVVRLEE